MVGTYPTAKVTSATEMGSMIIVPSASLTSSVLWWFRYIHGFQVRGFRYNLCCYYLSSRRIQGSLRENFENMQTVWPLDRVSLVLTSALSMCPHWRVWTLKAFSHPLNLLFSWDCSLPWALRFVWQDLEGLPVRQHPLRPATPRPATGPPKEWCPISLQLWCWISFFPSLLKPVRRYKVQIYVNLV